MTIKEVEKMIEDKTGGCEAALGDLALSISQAIIGWKEDRNFRERIFRRRRQ
ncbi:hypothetical protein ACFLR7_03875 [Acidobacteriota bacterium]